MEPVRDFIFLSSKITVDGDCRHENKRHLLLGRRAMTNLDSILKRREITWPTKVCIVKAIVFPTVRYGCESWAIKKGWMPKKRCLWTVVLEKTLESPLDSKVIKSINSKGNQPWNQPSLLEGLMLKLKLQYFGHLMQRANSQKKTDSGKDWGQEEKGATEIKMVGWHYQLNEHELDLTLSEGEGRIGCYSPWCHKE